jgi:hypothetical protein
VRAIRPDQRVAQAKPELDLRRDVVGALQRALQVFGSFGELAGALFGGTELAEQLGRGRIGC